MLSQKISRDAQKAVDKGDLYYRARNYDSAIEYFQQAVEKGDKSPLTAFKLGDSYQQSSEVDVQLKAIPHLEFAFQNRDETIPNEIYFALGKVYHKAERIAEAIINYEKYQETLSPRDKERKQRVERELELCKNALDVLTNRKYIDIRAADHINTELTEYNPVVSADESVLAYTALRPSGNVRSSGNEFVERIFISYNEGGGWTNPDEISVTTEFNYGTAGISADGQQMLIFIGGRNGSGNLYNMQKEGREWGVPDKLENGLNSNYLESTGSLTPDGKTIYFASNRPGGFGGMDIYKMEKREDGSWGKPLNLGDVINTKYDDDAPFIHPDQKTLYFTSEGHKNIGGKDIFRSILVDGIWKNPINMGYPINTTANDDYFTLTADGKKGYFSSDRKGGKGGRDIYYFDLPESEINIPLTMVKGRILAGDDLEPVPTEIQVIDKTSGEKIDYVYNPNSETGNYLIIFPPGRSYDMIIRAEGFTPQTININIPNQTYFYELYQKIELKPVKQFDVVVGQEISVKNKFYDSNQDNSKILRNDIPQRIAREAQLVQNDSLDLYDIMESIIGTGDSIALNYLLGLMYNTNPLDLIQFDDSDKDEVVEKVFYFEEDNEVLEMRILGNDTIFSMPSFSVDKEAENQKNAKDNYSAKYNESILDNIVKVYFSVGNSQVAAKYTSDLDGLLANLNQYDQLGIQISGFASSDGDDERNREISNQRAIAILDYFKGKGISRRRILAKGYGATQLENDPVKSRRVEIKLVDLNLQ